MNTILNRVFSIFIVLTLLLTFGLGTSRGAGLLKPIDGSDADLAMKAHQVTVTLNNGFARTEVDQVFVNHGNMDREAVYTFPLPRQASLSEVSLWIDGKEVVGEVLAKARAKAIYDDQRAKGNQSALATKDDFKRFEVRVAKVAAGGETRVRMVYYQPLEIDLNIGRYVYPLEEGNVDEEQIAFWTVDDKVEASFSFDLELKSAFPVKDIRMPGYTSEAQITKRADEESGEIYDVSLDFPEGGSLSRDIVLYYRLDDSVPARLELVPFREDPKGEGSFMVVVTPGADLKRIQHGTDWTFVLDVSGSMGGNKIATLADAVCRVIGKMVPEDRFRVVTFNDKAKEFSSGYINATPENVNTMIGRIKAIQAGGGTALYEGLETAYDGLDADRITGIILVTDGVANVGPSKYSDLMNLHRRHDIRLFTFVIGNSANRPLLNNLAKESGGFAMNISTSDDIIGRIIQAKAKVLHESIYDAKLKFHGERVKNLVPAKIGNLYAGQQVVMFGRYNGAGRVKIEMTGRIAGQEKRWTCWAMLPEEDRDNPEIERLWALAAIEEHMTAIRDGGETEALRKKVVDLGVAYSLVTDYTAMVVAAESEMEEAGIQRKNAQRVEKERKAQAKRAQAPVKSYRADNSATAGSNPQGQGDQQDNRKPMFDRPSFNIGSGPVGPLFLLLVAFVRRKKR